MTTGSENLPLSGRVKVTFNLATCPDSSERRLGTETELEENRRYNVNRTETTRSRANE